MIAAMTPLAARVAGMFALTLVVVAVWPLAADLSAPLKLDYFQVAALGSSLIAMTGTLLLWRRYVRWTRGRSLGTASLACVVIGQVLAWTPVWNVRGCTEPLMLCTSQSMLTLGLWLAGCCLVWWSARLRSRQPLGAVSATKGTPTMSPTAARLVSAFALLPFLPGLFIFWVITESYYFSTPDEVSGWRAYEACIVLTLFVWVRLWRRDVRWNPGRIRMTMILAGLLMLSPFAIFLPTSADPANALKWMAPLWFGAVWFAGTAWLWRNPAPQTGDDLVARLASCPSCGYSLIGLSEIRCPECGWVSTVDGLLEARTRDVLVEV